MVCLVGALTSLPTFAGVGGVSVAHLRRDPSTADARRVTPRGPTRFIRSLLCAGSGYRIAPCGSSVVDTHRAAHEHLSP